MIITREHFNLDNPEEEVDVIGFLRSLINGFVRYGGNPPLKLAGAGSGPDFARVYTLYVIPEDKLTKLDLPREVEEKIFEGFTSFYFEGEPQEEGPIFRVYKPCNDYLFFVKEPKHTNKFKTQRGVA